MDIEGVGPGASVGADVGDGDEVGVERTVTAEGVLLAVVVLVGVRLGSSTDGADSVPAIVGVAGGTKPTRWQAASRVLSAPRAKPTNRRRDTTGEDSLTRTSSVGISGPWPSAVSGLMLNGTIVTNLSSCRAHASLACAQ